MPFTILASDEGGMKASERVDLHASFIRGGFAGHTDTFDFDNDLDEEWSCHPVRSPSRPQGPRRRSSW
ncbi:hypothetical protein GZL_08170 [Streptomyces sp. 769]|nr:hypothetical protein GZL_08170 [Streptomyces sp. 769]